MISKRILGVLLILFVAALYYGYVETPRQERVASGTHRAIEPAPPAGKRPAAARANRSDAIPQLRIDLLDRQPQAYTGVQRDLFHSARIVASAPVVEPEPEPEPIVPQERIAPAVVPVPPPPAPTPQELTQKELARFKFLGFFKKGEKRTIFLASGDEVYLVRKGDAFGRHRDFRVLDLTATSLKLRKEGAGEFTIQLVDQAPLSAVPIPPENYSEGSGPAANPALPGAVRRFPSALSMPVQPDIEIAPDDQPQAEDQIQPEEEPDETQN